MSVLIRGMKMPTSCADCQIGNALCCPLMPGVPALWAEYTKAVQEKRMHSDCPLIPIQKHGRLIDADAVERNLLKMRQAQTGPCSHGIRKSRAVLRNAPTIISEDNSKEE